MGNILPVAYGCCQRLIGKNLPVTGDTLQHVLHSLFNVGMAPVLTLVPPDDATTIGQRLRTARGHRKQEDMAKEAKVSVRTLRNWESDSTSPTVDGVKLIAKATGWPAAYLFGIDDNGDGRTPDGDPAATSLYAPRDSNPEPAELVPAWRHTAAA